MFMAAAETAAPPAVDDDEDGDEEEDDPLAGRETQRHDELRFDLIAAGQIFVLIFSYQEIWGY